MAVERRVITKVDNFDYPLTLTTTPQGAFGWRVADTSSGGTPTYAVITAVDGGAMQLLLDNTSEVQNVCMYQNDILLYDWAKIQWCEWTVKMAAAAVSNDTITWGLANARNDTIASITEKILFKILASTSTTNVVIDTKDGTTAVTGTSTATSVGVDTFKKYTIDFTNGLSDVRFFIDGSRVCTTTTFNFSGVTSGNNCQLFCQVQKASGTTVPDFRVSRVAIQYLVNDS